MDHCINVNTDGLLSDCMSVTVGTLAHTLTLSLTLTRTLSGFGGLEVACCPLVPKFAGSHPAEAVAGEVKPSVPCRSFTACNGP
jgi:hypothetical protein